jgi:KDO2-lipid IV(A) lauroyltransferase
MIFATLRLLHISFFRFLGYIFFYSYKKRRNVALANVKKCYFFMSENTLSKKHTGEVKKKAQPSVIVKKSFACLGTNLADFLLLPFYTKKNIDRFISIENENYLKSSIALGRGVILSTAHFGSWELAAHVMALKNFKSLIVYNKFKKHFWLDDFIKKRRELSGNSLLPKQNAFLSLYKHLKGGGIITLVTDQHAVPPDGIKVPLLGQDAWTHTAFIKMSLKTGAIIVPVFIFPKNGAKYSIKFYEPINPKNFRLKDDSIFCMARKCNRALEDAILRSPESWMWQHRRFKSLVKDRI